MRKILIKLILLIAFTTSSCSLIPAKCENNLELEASNVGEIQRYKNCEAIVSGVVYNTYTPKSGKVIYLNLGNSNYKKAFTVVIFAQDIKKFADTPLNLKGKSIEVHGSIGDYQGKPQMIINSPNQIKVLPY